jgi:hypothetical protein
VPPKLRLEVRNFRRESRTPPSHEELELELELQLRYHEFEALQSPNSESLVLTPVLQYKGVGYGSHNSVLSRASEGQSPVHPIS